VRLRWLALGFALPLVAQSHAQMFSGAIGSGVRLLQDHELIPRPEQVNPTQPSGNPIPPVKNEADLPTPDQLGPEEGAFNLIYSGDWETIGPLIHVTGGVEFTDRGYHCWADELLGNQDTNVFTLKGNVRVEAKDESIRGETIQVDFNRKTFVAENSESTLRPALTKGQTKGDVYVKGASSFGSERELFGENTSTTTCSYPSPHFEIISESTDVRPGRRVIFRKVKLSILGHVVLKLPYLSVPLDERSYNNLPVVGKDTIAGYFIKTRYSFPSSGNSVISTRVDYYSRLGLGLGAGIKYNSLQSRGSLNLFTIQGPHPEFELIGQHRQDFKWGTLTLDSSYEDNNYLASPNSKILNTRAQLYLPQGRSSDRFSYYRTVNNSSSSNSLQQTISATDTRAWNSKLNTSLDVKLSDTSSSFTGGQPIHREQADVNFRAVDDLQLAIARLDYIRSIPIGESSNFFAASDVTPAFSLLSDSKKLFGSQFDSVFPFTTQVGFGEFGDPISKGHITRTDFDFAFQNRAKQSKHWDLNYQGEFKQDLYSDNTAQYSLRAATQITYNFHDNSRFHISYNYLRPYGFSPLQIDRRGQTNTIQSDLSYAPLKHVLVGFATGYDFNLIKQHQPTPWQQVGLQASYTLDRTFQFRALSTYDTTQHTFSSTRFDLTLNGKSTFLSVGAKYDGQRNKWAAANMYLDGLQIGRLRSSVLLNYNGYTNQFDAMHFSFIYDLHCAEAVFQIIDNPTGFNGGRAFYFFIRLKALPFDTPFGTGTRGQPIGTGTGRDF
jgi:hypothetical protein